MNESDKLLKNLLIIIFLTNIPAFLSLFMFFSESIGWILGSLGSAVNLIWLAQNVKKNLDVLSGKAKVQAVRGYFLRYFFLIAYSSVVILLIKPDILLYGLGLLAGQLAIYLHFFWNWLRQNKYFRG
jgi:hypothetical protein